MCVSEEKKINDESLDANDETLNKLTLMLMYVCVCLWMLHLLIIPYSSKMTVIIFVV